MTTTTKSKSIKITGEGKYPSVPLDQIEIVERPAKGRETEQLFYNPRSIESFTPAEMQELLLSIRTDGLQQPPQVRALTEKGKVVAVQLIAGERRLRTLLKIVENDYPCFDEDAEAPKKYRAGAVVLHKGRFAKVVSHKTASLAIQFFLADGLTLGEEQRDVAAEEVFPTIPGSKLYHQIPCRVAYDCTDERALRLAFTENDKSQSLETREEIALVERLQRMGMKQGEIADMLGTNETWVSQTLNFQEALPKEAYKKLLDGTMTRHVAVHIMGFKPEDRQKLFEATKKAEEEDTARRLEEAQDELEQAEDEEELALAEAKKAEQNDDETTAKKARRTVRSAQTRQKKAKEKKDRVEDEKGTIKQSHVARGAAAANLSPKKAKMMPKEQIQEIIDSLAALEDGETEDPDYGENIPADLVMAVRRTCTAILEGRHSPGLDIIRSIQIDLGRWDAVDVEDEEEFETDAELDAELDEEFGDDFDDDDDEDYNPVAELDRMGYDDED